VGVHIPNLACRFLLGSHGIGGVSASSCGSGGRDPPALPSVVCSDYSYPWSTATLEFRSRLCSIASGVAAVVVEPMPATKLVVTVTPASAFVLPLQPVQLSVHVADEAGTATPPSPPPQRSLFRATGVLGRCCCDRSDTNDLVCVELRCAGCCAALHRVVRCVASCCTLRCIVLYAALHRVVRCVASCCTLRRSASRTALCGSA
jgi:hypothetical protein